MTAEQKLTEILTSYDGETNEDFSTGHFRKWLIEQFEKSSTNKANDETRLEDFAVYFLNSVRQQTEIHLRCTETNIETPKCQTPVRSLKVAYNSENNNLLTPKRVFMSVGQQNKTSTPEPQKVHSLDESSQRWNDSLNAQDICNFNPSTSRTRPISPSENGERINNSSLKSNTSTPVRRTSSKNQSHNRRACSNSFSNICQTTPPTSAEKSTRSTASSSSMCLGDFLVLNTANSRSHKKKQNNSNSQHNLSANDSTATPPTGSKPKKRVVPTTITNGRTSNSSAFGNNSTFSNENNILTLSHIEIDDKNKCAILEARKSLKQNADKITKELESAVGESKLIDVTATSAEMTTRLDVIELLSPIDLKTVKQPSVIKKIAYLYTTLMDLNFTTNVLNEISFLLNILNANETDKSEPLKDDENEATLSVKVNSLQLTPAEKSTTTCTRENPIELLKNATNCIYFALSVLRMQQNTLAMLDLKSLGVVLHSERILTLSQELKTFLENAYQHKQNEIQKSKQQDSDFSFRLDNSSFNNVTYQEDKDSRQNFPSNNEFGAFKSQRDLFYKTLKCWESNHLNTAWNFQQEITPNIREIFKLSEHPINMAHFAKLFVSQLLISSNYASSPEEIGVDIDIQKFSKLTQRLLAPSKFSVDYQFPHNQVFFRDFIYEARSIAFLEQLKLTIYAKLIALNDSSYEMLNILKATNDEDNDTVSCPNEFMVRPEILSSMQVLAKFLGFVTVLPYNYNSTLVAPPQTSALDKKQVVLRSLFQPNFNLSKLLQDALKSGKILITLPWLVQYLAMLDNVTLQLDNYVEVIKLLFCIYMHIASFVQETGNEPPTVFATTLFIIRCCLGWLFDTKSIIAEQYYTYRIINENKKECLLPMNWQISCNNDAIKVHPIIESMLNIACPFLAEFRVSIMPAKYSMAKYVSRTGRYRHITTRISELSTSSALNSPQQSTAEKNSEQIQNLNAKQQSENKLIEAFLHSQNLTMRRLIEFIIERVYKSTVKDAQFKILLPSKATADKKVNEITSNVYGEVYQLVHEIYNEARLTAISSWNELVPHIISERTTKALDALLQEDIEPKTKEIYYELIKRNTTTKVLQWRHANMFKTNFYCANFEDMAQKICKVNSKSLQTATTTTSSELCLINSTPSVSTTLDELQYLLHCTSMRPEIVQSNAQILKLLHTLPITFKNVLPTALYRVVSVSIIQLLQNIIARHPFIMTTELIDAFNATWLSEEMQRHAIVLNKQYQLEAIVNDADKQQIATTDISDTSNNAVIIPNIFESLITISFIESMGARNICYDKLCHLLVAMIKVNIINVDFINGLFLKIFKLDWDPSVLNEISNMLTRIANESQEGCDGGFSADDDGKSNLFMEVLADFSRDIDNF